MNNLDKTKTWNLASDLSLEVYEIITNSLREKDFSLADEIIRSCASLLSNISESSIRDKNNDFKKALYISLGNLKRLDSGLIIAEKLNYINSIDLNKIKEKIDILDKEILKSIN